MKLLFRGANREVTGSRHILAANGAQILLDCGMYQGRRKESEERNKNFDFDPKTIDCVVLSHAHIDHSGNLPNLVKQGFDGQIYCTPATADLLTYMLGDSAHIQEREAEYVNKKRRNRGEETLVQPLYTQEDVEDTLALLRKIPYDSCTELTQGVSLCFHEAGHILGSAVSLITVEDEEDGQTKRLLFTGDLGRQNMPILRDPYQIPEAEYLLTESTYGNRVHESLLEAEDALATIIQNTISRGGRVLIPAFSLGRTQEIIYSLHKLSHDGKIPEGLPVYVDSPLSVNVTSVFRQHLNEMDEETQKLFISEHEDPFGFEKLKYITEVEDSKALNSHQGPCIIVSSSGMVEHGRILHHLKNAIEDHRNALIIVGYQAMHTLGRKLIEGQKEVNIFGDPHRVKMEIHKMNAYSAHADRSDLLDYASKVKGLKKIILVHGEDGAIDDLKTAMESNGLAEEVVIPSYGDELEL